MFMFGYVFHWECMSLNTGDIEYHIFVFVDCVNDDNSYISMELSM